MSKQSDRAAAKAEQAAIAALADLPADDYEEALEDLIQALKDRLAAQRATRQER
jgi:hypothetical protein